MSNNKTTNKDSKISKPGQYSGYSEEIYKDVVCTSKYLNIRGINIAVDIYRPSNDGINSVDDPYPVIYQHYAYNRGRIGENNVHYLVKHGYVVIVDDARGTGASFGCKPYQFNREEALDSRDLIEWAAVQPWCNGKIGMFGGSQMGGTQLLIAATNPPHLLSIMPAVTTIDQFMRHPNGVHLNMPGKPGMSYPAETGKPVDADTSGSMVEAAIKEHNPSPSLFQMWPGPYVYRNSYITEIKDMPSIVSSPITYSDEIKGSCVKMYNVAGWYDQAPTSQLGAWKLWGGKLIIGPWIHGTMCDSEMPKVEMVRIETLRWMDFTLKDIGNGIDNEPSIYYCTVNAPKNKEWKSTSKWPLPNQQLTKYYFNDKPTKTVKSTNDGSLGTSLSQSSSSDTYKIDYSIRLFDGEFKENSRFWDGDMTGGVDRKGLTYTSEYLLEDTEVTGHPIVHLWVSSTSKDGDFHAFLEEIDGNSNKSSYVTNGMIRASNRELSTRSPWTDLGLPYHRCWDIDAKPLVPEEIVELVFDMYPISYVFRRGNRIRVTITGANAPIYPGIVEDPPPTVNIYHGSGHASCIELPVITSED
jgi:putative CocE/NonD family hydrolase